MGIDSGGRWRRLRWVPPFENDQRFCSVATCYADWTAGFGKERTIPALNLQAYQMKTFIIVVVILALILLTTLGYLFTPSVYAARTSHGVTVHVATLGEYPSDIDRIEIVEKGRFELVPGPNIDSLKPSYGMVQTDIPAHGSFALERGIAYRASVCFRGWPYTCRDADFIFGSSSPR